MLIFRGVCLGDAFDIRPHQALGVEQIGHRLLLARGILALEQQ